MLASENKHPGFYRMAVSEFLDFRTKSYSPRFVPIDVVQEICVTVPDNF